MDNTTRSEWANLVTSRTKPEQAQLARYAFNNHWWDLGVQATIAGRLRDHLKECFPLAYKGLFTRYTSDKDIRPNCAMAIARQESAWNPKVKSPVGASGPMQIISGTATHTVKMLSIPGYNSPSQLLDPDTNINVGTGYLQYVYQQFDNSHIFASAAYSVGPGRVHTWLGNSAGCINAVAFVENIPFSETRGCVESVPAYDMYYHYFLGDKPELMSEAEWQRRY